MNNRAAIIINRRLQAIAIIAMISIFFLAGCKKGDSMQNQLLEGIVLHSITKAPMANQNVTLVVYMAFQMPPGTDPEFPNGEVLNGLYRFQGKTNAEGRYSINARFPEGSWQYSVNARTNEYVTLYGISRFFNVDPVTKEKYADTIFMEKAAYVKYTINTMGIPFDNETLKVRTPYTMTRIPKQPVYDPSGYNWYFYGKQNVVIYDTIPAEKFPNPEVEWLRFQFDTIQYKKEVLHLEPLKTIEYTIKY